MKKHLPEAAAVLACCLAAVCLFQIASLRGEIGVCVPISAIRFPEWIPQYRRFTPLSAASWNGAPAFWLGRSSGMRGNLISRTEPRGCAAR